MPSISNFPIDIDIDWRAIDQLFQASQYDQIADLLDLPESAGAGAEQTPFRPALASVRQISLACRQCRADVEWHRQAALAAEQREALLKANAQTILNWVTDRWPSEAGQTDQATAGQRVEGDAAKESLSIARRLRNLLQALKGLHTFESAPPTPQIEQLARPDPTQLETAPVDPTDMRQETADALQLAAATRQAPISDDSQSGPARTGQSYTLMIHCLGAFRVYQHDELIEEWNGLKGQAIFKYLLAQRGTPVSKDILMDLFWPDVEPEAARRNLHQAIYSLRQTLRRRDQNVQYIQFEHNQYFLNPELSVWLDIEEFSAQMQNGRRLELAGQLAEAIRSYAVAVNLYQGDFLAEDLYEDWPIPRRQQLRMDFLEIANRKSVYHYQQADYTAAIALCQQILTLDNCFEEAHRRLMQIYHDQGQRHLAIRQYHLCAEALAAELDVPPAEETTALYGQITNQ